MAWEDEFKTCRVCNKPVPKNRLALALRHKEKKCCSTACMRLDIIKTFGCCNKAKLSSCVCMYSFTCPVHGEKHIGTHD